MRVLGVLEPGGAQLSALRLSRAQGALGVQTRLLAGAATPQGLALAQLYGFEAEAMVVHDEIGYAVQQWTPDPLFAQWLGDRLGGADLVHAHMVGAWWAAAQSAPARLPLMASEHNALTWPLGDHTATVAEVAPRVDRFFVHGPDPHAFVRPLGVDPERVETGRSAVSVNSRPRPGLFEPRVTFTGRLREDKGPDLLLLALATLPDPPATYVVGDGPMMSRLRDLTELLGLDRVVRFTGWSHEPTRYVAGSSVHVVPSREEAWSQSAVTALALGVPVVATAVDGLPVTLAHGRGLLVDVDPTAIGTAIQAVLDGRVDVDVAGGRRYAAAFQPAEIASEYFAVYQQVLASRALIRPL